MENYEVISCDSPFKTRVTTVEWHPKRRNRLTVGGKHGDIVFYKIDANSQSAFEETGRVAGVWK